MKPSADNIRKAHEQLSKYLHQTPIIESSTINQLVGNGNQVYLKMDVMQKTGSFKARGACWAALNIEQKTLDQPTNIITHSSGNHGIALAYISKLLGYKAHIIIPKGTPKCKFEAIERYGGEVHISGSSWTERVQLQSELIKQYQAIEIHPFDNWHVITGASTLVYEFLQQQPDLDYIFAPIGGGGICSGSILSAKYFSPKTKIVGVEPKNAADAHLSLQIGSPQPQFLPINTIADGLRTQLCSFCQGTLNKNKQGIDEILLVEEQDIIETTLLIWKVTKTLVETSSGIVLAALLKNKDKYKNMKIGVLLGGGNVDFNSLISFLQ